MSLLQGLLTRRGHPQDLLRLGQRCTLYTHVAIRGHGSFPASFCNCSFYSNASVLHCRLVWRIIDKMQCHYKSIHVRLCHFIRHGTLEEKKSIVADRFADFVGKVRTSYSFNIKIFGFDLFAVDEYSHVCFCFFSSLLYSNLDID